MLVTSNFSFSLVFHSYISLVKQNAALCGNGLIIEKVSIQALFISLPDNKILDVTKLKAFADDKSNVAKMTISHFDRVENTVEKGENAGDQHFHLLPQCFPKPPAVESLKVGILW